MGALAHADPDDQIAVEIAHLRLLYGHSIADASRNTDLFLYFFYLEPAAVARAAVVLDLLALTATGSACGLHYKHSLPDLTHA